MIPLKKLNLLSQILQETKDDKQLERIYTDALIVLYEMGITPMGNCYEIDGQKYPFTSLAANVITKKQKQKTPAFKPEKKDAVEKKTVSEVSQPEKTVETKEEDVLDQFMNASISLANKTSPVIVSRHNIKVVNKKNPSDFKEFLFLVTPLTIQDNSSAGDIAIVVDRGVGKEPLAFVSSAATGRKSIDFEVDGFQFFIRGEWKNRVFSANFYLTGNTEYKIADSSKEIAPDETIDPNDYAAAFVKRIKDSKIYILPLARVNEPNGLAKIVVIQENEQSRQVNCPEENVLMAYIGGNDYRIYARWDGPNFQISTDVM